MKKKLVLHIGMGKTGTTALQTFFLSNHRKLKKYGICYPQYGLKGGAHHLLSPYRPPFISDRWKFKEVAEWAPALAKISQGTVLLSSELMAWADDSSVQKFCSQAGEFFNLSVVIYLRRQDHVIAASHSQMIKAGKQKRRIEKVYREQIPKFDYLNIIERWSSELGSNNTIVRPYESEQFFHNDIRFDFMHHVFDISECKDLKLSSKKSNPRLSLAASEYKRLINSIAPGKRLNLRFNKLLFRYSKELERADSGLFSNQEVLSLAQREEILKQHQQGNECIAVRYLDRNNGKLFLEPLPCADAEYQSYELLPGEAVNISRYLWRRNPLLMWLLSRRLRTSMDAQPFLERTAAKRLAQSMPRGLKQKQ